MRARLLGMAVAVATVIAVAACGAAEPETESHAWTPGTPPPSEPAVQLLPRSHAVGAAPTPSPTPAPVAPAPAPESPAEPAPPPPAPPPPEREPEPDEAPPPPPPRYEGECIADYRGPARSHAEVAAALKSAAGQTYWPTSAPSIRVPENLLRATAWQESGWQTNVIACDGGVGVMQVMPDTASWMNTRFGQSYDINVYTDNAYLGGTYLAWLIKYLGDRYFDGDYSVSAGDCADHLDPCLLNLVIASYNFGHGAVDGPDGPAVPNPRYVENVRALMSNCECLSY